MKFDLKTNFAYGIGQAGDTIPYCMFYTYFVYYLTDVVGLSPMVAGAVSLVAVCWDGITDPVVGFLSDHSKNPRGRRRPWMIKSIFPLAIVVFLLFAPFDFSSDTLATIYYLVVAVLFWTLYTTYVIPYMSLGAELTSDYNGRNYVRMFNMILGGLFMLLCTSGPMTVWSWGAEKGLSDRAAWGVSGAIFGMLALICGLICFFATKGKEMPKEEIAELPEEKESIIVVLKETFSIKAYRQLCCMTFFIMIGYIVAGTAVVYLLVYNCGMTDAQQSVFWIVYAVAYVVMVPIGSAIANRLGKKASFFVGQIITVSACVVFFFTGIWTFTAAVIYITIYQFGSTVFWTNYLAFAYDCAEVDEYKTGKRREGSLCAIVSFAQKIGSGIGTYCTGALLVFCGYDANAAVQTDSALTGICGLCTLAPAISGVIAMIFMIRYPITKKDYERILDAVEAKKSGQAVDEDEFKHCL